MNRAVNGNPWWVWTWTQHRNATFSNIQNGTPNGYFLTSYWMPQSEFRYQNAVQHLLQGKTWTNMGKNGPSDFSHSPSISDVSCLKKTQEPKRNLLQAAQYSSAKLMCLTVLFQSFAACSARIPLRLGCRASLIMTCSAVPSRSLLCMRGQPSVSFCLLGVCKRCERSFLKIGAHQKPLVSQERPIACMILKGLPFLGNLKVLVPPSYVCGIDTTPGPRGNLSSAVRAQDRAGWVAKLLKERKNTTSSCSKIKTGWWFGTFLFSHILGIIIPID